MKVVKKIEEDDIEYTREDLVELSEDIDWLIDNKPKGVRKGTKRYKDWLKSIDTRMSLYNSWFDTPVYVKKYSE